MLIEQYMIESELKHTKKSEQSDGSKSRVDAFFHFDDLFGPQ
jgi:hypothetical protein